MKGLNVVEALAAASACVTIGIRRGGHRYIALKLSCSERAGNLSS